MTQTGHGFALKEGFYFGKDASNLEGAVPKAGHFFGILDIVQLLRMLLVPSRLFILLVPGIACNESRHNAHKERGDPCGISCSSCCHAGSGKWLSL